MQQQGNSIEGEKMKTIIKLKYMCRWCKMPFERETEYLDNYIMENRLHQMHFCNESEHKKFPDVIKLRSGIGDCIGYTIVEYEP
jgi:hypothetical protein